MDYLLVVAGLIALLLGGDWLVRGAVGVAHRFAMPPMLIGLTVVGFGTSMPELLVSVDAALRGLPDIALGNVVGSNIANILLIGGVAALLWPIRLNDDKGLIRDCAMMLAAALVLLPLMLIGGGVGRLAGAALVLGLIIYLVIAYRSAVPEAAPEGVTLSLGRSSLWVIGGLIALMLGARSLIEGAVSLARDFGVSEAYIGLTIVAVGTSLPELVTSVIAALRKQSEIAIGNILGSNVFNIFGILGITAVITPVAAAPRFASFDVPVMIAVSLGFALALILAKGLGRLVGAGFVAAYVAYLACSPM